MINFTGGKTIKYTYSADGHKLRAVYTTVTPVTSKQVDYCGNLIFENGQLKQVLVDGGYIPMDDWSGTYRFYVKDHLGNNRMVVHQSGTIEQVNNYYPYGGLMANTTGWNAQRFKYNGKEFDRMHGLDWYDYGARWMDASIGRWHSVDPLCEKYYNVSPYVYCAGNPVRFIDPDGKEVRIWYKDSQNNDQCFTFTGFHGQKTISIPKNDFVKAVVQAYVFNCKNGAGDKFRNAVYSSDVIYIDDARLYKGENEFKNYGHLPTVYWNPEIGIKTTEGGSQSPATSLEHEMDHAVDYMNNTKQHNLRSNTYDAQYDTKEEKRVITGSEAKTAKANGESIRTNHAGNPYKTKSPISTEEDKCFNK